MLIKEVLEGYGVDSYGNVYRLEKTIEYYNIRKGINYGLKKVKLPLKKMKLQTDKNGYQWVNIGNHNYKVHRLVAQAFIPNPENLPQINHKNEIKNDNRAENLEWCTSKYNINYGTAMERAKKTRDDKGYYWMSGAMEKRKKNNPNNEMYFKIAESRRKNGTNRMYALMKSVKQFDLEGNFIAEYPSITDAAIAVNGTRKNISNCINGKQLTANGYKWSV